MEQVSIRNPELLTCLNKYKDLVIPQRDKIELRGELDEENYYSSREHLNTMLDKADTHIGFPEVTYGNDLLDRSVSPFFEEVFEIRQELGNILVSPNCAVMMYYPEGGFMSWHNNHNCPGYNILLSWTETGNGFFKYLNLENDSLVTMHDSPGWTAKVGYYGSNDEPDKLYWHCAKAFEPRLTLGYVIPDKQMWEMMVDDIQAE